MERFHCEFKNCTCNEFISKNKLCSCSHHKLWHSKKGEPPPTDGKLQFMSPRKNAHRPKYVSKPIFGQVHIFKPLPLAPAIEVANPCFCPDSDVLPV